MQAQDTALNPFALMMDPAAVLQAMEGSTRLRQLQSRVCRPLDKPLIPHKDDAVEAFDRGVDGEPTAMGELSDIIRD